MIHCKHKYCLFDYSDESSGTSRDWAKGVPAITYVYTIELRSESSFVLPPDQIEPTGAEVLAGLRSAFVAIQQVNPGLCKIPVM